MHFQIQHLLRFNLSPAQRKRTLERILWTVSAQQRGGRAAAAGSHASAHIKKYFALQYCRNYASDTAYSRAFASARDNPETFWAEMAQDINWFEPWSKTLHVEDPVFPNW